MSKIDSDPAHSGAKSVIAALIGNTLVTILKSIVAFSTGSASMFAESVHSLADTLNQSLLLIGVKRSTRIADHKRGYGYGIERFFWSLVSACGILFIGAGVTIYHSLSVLLSSGHQGDATVNISTIVVLIVALVIEGYTLLIAVNELKGGNPLTAKSFRDADPVTLAVVYEDGAAVIGVIIALIAQALLFITKNPAFDALGGLLVGILLAALAMLLIVKNYHYIIGKPLDDEVAEQVTDFLLRDPCIEQVLEFKSEAIDVGKYRIFATVEWNGTPLYEEIYGDGDLREEFENIKDDFGEFAKLMFRTTDRIPRLMGRHIDKIEKQLREEMPMIAYIDIEIN